MGQARRVLLTGTLLAILAAGALAVTQAGERTAGLSASLAGLRESLEAVMPGRGGAPEARLPAPRTAIEDGRTVVHLTEAERARRIPSGPCESTEVGWPGGPGCGSPHRAGAPSSGRRPVVCRLQRRDAGERVCASSHYGIPYARPDCW